MAVGDELMSVLVGLRRRVRRRLRPEAPGPKLRGAQVELLRAVEEQSGIGVRGAAETLHLAPNSVSTLVNQLVAMGMLERHPDPDDRRAAQLQLTDLAEHRLAYWRKARSELVGAGVAQLPEADQEALQQALPALRQLLVNLSVDEPPDLEES